VYTEAVSYPKARARGGYPPWPVADCVRIEIDYIIILLLHMNVNLNCEDCVDCDMCEWGRNSYNCRYCQYCSYCNYCEYCTFCVYCKNLRVTSYNYFCRSKELGSKAWHKQRKYRMFNVEVWRDVYHSFRKVLSVKLEFDTNEDASTRYYTAFKKLRASLDKAWRQEYLDIPHFNWEWFTFITWIKEEDAKLD